MNKYLVMYHAPPSFTEKMSKLSQEEGMAEMAKWMEWSNKIGDALVDLGTPLGGGTKLMKAGSNPSDREVTGYSMIQAESMEAAMKLLDSHPHLLADDTCEIEVHETVPLPGGM